jgi:hypothetical protein
MTMKKILALLGLAAALALSACASQVSTLSAVTTATVPISAAVTAANTFDTVVPAATAYLQTCAIGSNACASRAAVAPITKAVRAGILARKQVVSLALASCGVAKPLPATLPAACASTAIPATSYNTLVSSYGTVKSILSLYAVKSN